MYHSILIVFIENNNLRCFLRLKSEKGYTRNRIDILE
jgi:hypothetical protein